MTTVNYTDNLGLALPSTGDLSGTWGTTVNDYISTYIDTAVAGALAVSLTGNLTLSKTTGSTLGSSSSQYAILNVTPNASTWTITAPVLSKVYVVNNLSGTYTFVIKISGQTGVTVAASEKCIVAYNGTDFAKVASTVVSAASLSGTVPIANGGTNATATPTAGGVSYGTGTAYAFSGVGTAGQALLSNAASAPSFGTLGIAAGGTGQTTAANALNALGGIGTGKSIAMAMIFGF
jgi:hypothetical protein